MDKSWDEKYWLQDIEMGNSSQYLLYRQTGYVVESRFRRDVLLAVQLEEVFLCYYATGNCEPYFGVIFVSHRRAAHPSEPHTI
jgi:hypothetical protein